MATVVKYGTKAGEGLIRDMNYKHPKGKSLYDVYGSVSKKKRDSWEEIRLECCRLGGGNLHIIGAASYNYSCAYSYPIMSEKGEIIDMVIVKHTKGNKYEMTMPIEEYEERIYR